MTLRLSSESIRSQYGVEKQEAEDRNKFSFLYKNVHNFKNIFLDLKKICIVQHF